MIGHLGRSTAKLDGTRIRRGSVTVLVLVVLLISSAVLMQLVRRALLDGRQVAEQLLQEQTQELAHAGELKARQTLQKDAAWVGETWKLPAGEIHQTNSGEVVITVDTDNVTVVARYPVNRDRPVQVTRQFEIESRSESR